MVYYWLTAMRKILFGLLVLIGVCKTVNAFANQPEAMQFELVPPKKPIEVFGNAWWIFANGIIDEGAGRRLADLIEDHNIPDDSLIFFNSPGGKLFTGMEIGKIIRSHNFSSYVGAQGDEEADTMHVAGWGGKSYKTQPGACESACALAFLGGSFRYISNGSIYGVHRFFATTGAFDGDSAQIVSAAVQQYIRDMGVAPELFAEMTQASKDTMNYLPENRLKSLGIVNDGSGKTTWTIAPVGNVGLVLKGDRDTVWGYQKIVLGCTNAGLVAFAVFDPKGNADAIVNMSAISFNINENAVHLPAGRIVEKPTLIRMVGSTSWYLWTIKW